MAVAYPARHRNRRGLLLAAALLILGAGGFFALRGGSDAPERTKQFAENRRPASVAPPFAVTTVPTKIASLPTAAMSAASSALRSAPRWQASLQPSVVAATRVESLSAFQVQMEKWSCEGDQCVGNLRIPLNTDAGRNRDISAPADILDVLQKKMAESDISVALRSVHPDSQGVAVSFEFSPDASRQGRFYTDEEIASIRMESVLQGSKLNCKDPAR